MFERICYVRYVWGNLTLRRRVPFAGQKTSSSGKDAVCLLQRCGLSLVSSAPKKWHLTRWPFQKRTPQGQFRGPPTYTHQVWRKSVKGPQRSRGTNRQTNAARIIVWYKFFYCTVLYSIVTNTFAVISLVAYIAQHDPKTLVLLFSYTFASHVQKHFVHTFFHVFSNLIMIIDPVWHKRHEYQSYYSVKLTCILTPSA